MNILIVDDEEPLRTLTAQYVSNAGHMPVAVASGAEAIEAFGVFDIDMVILDVTMQEMDGFETCVKIREILGERWIPIVFLTANTETEHYEKGIASGADDYLLKPANPVVLRAKINAMARIVDINAKLEKAYAELEKQSLVDSLTQVTNRKGFFDHAERCLKTAKRDKSALSVLMIDVDHFKQFNDNYGHLKGDEVLRTAAEEMASKLRRPLDMFARYGGEEFVAIFPNTDYEGVQQAAEAMRLAVAELNVPHSHGGGIGFVTVSVGMCYCVDASEFTLEDIISAAGKALYISKDQGRNKVSYSTLGD